MAIALDKVRVSKFVAALNLLSDFARNNHDFFAELEEWKHTRELGPSILTFIEGFDLFTTDERKRFVEFLEVLSMVLEEAERSNQ